MPARINNTTPRRPSKVYLKEWLEYRGMSAEHLAGKINASKSVISKLANGRQRYNRDWLEKIAWGLDCEVAHLFRPPESSVADDLLAKMTPETRETAIRVLSDLAELKTGSKR